MAHVVWTAGIEYVSGALCKCGKKGSHTHSKMLLATHRVAATTNPNCNRIYVRDEVQRSTPVTSKELRKRIRFAAVAQAVLARGRDLSKISQDQINFLAQRDNIGGKKTMRSYLWSLELASYDAEHPES